MAKLTTNIIDIPDHTSLAVRLRAISKSNAMLSSNRNSTLLNFQQNFLEVSTQVKGGLFKETNEKQLLQSVALP